MRILTKKEALEICIKMWTWLAENPSEGKGKAIEVLSLGPLDSDCAACHYVEGLESSKGCGDCPVWTGVTKCCHWDSPYHKWNYWELNDSLSDKAANAWGVVALAQAELDKLGDDE